MKEDDIKFFKIISIIICAVLCIGVGSYIYNNTDHRTAQEKLNDSNDAYIKSLK